LQKQHIFPSTFFWRFILKKKYLDILF
jgi:hypothetical protein